MDPSTLEMLLMLRLNREEYVVGKTVHKTLLMGERARFRAEALEKAKILKTLKTMTIYAIVAVHCRDKMRSIFMLRPHLGSRLVGALLTYGVRRRALSCEERCGRRLLTQ